MRAASYPAARIAAKRLEEHLSDKVPANDVVATADAIEQVISAAFWASLRREEGRSPKISLTLLPPDQTAHRLMFDPWLTLAPDRLARMAPAVERPGIHLGVWWHKGELAVWGTTRILPKYCFVLEVLGPGLMVVKYRQGDESAKFTNFAVLEGAEVKFIDHSEPLGKTLTQLATSIRAHGHGGTLLVVPRQTHEWRESVIRPLTYSVEPPYSEISILLKGEDPGGSIHAAIAMLAGLTAVDGATIVSDDFDVLAFGAKITRRDGAQRVQQLVLMEPFEGAVRLEMEPTQFGGTRHLSAAQFVHDQRNAVGLVASQDGRFTVFRWSDQDRLVHAHRIEALLI